MSNIRVIDVEKMAFDQLEQYTPHVAELLLQMAARPAPLDVLVKQLRARALAYKLGEDDYLTAVIALRYARRHLSSTSTGH